MEEAEVLRLRRLMQDNILKVEKENLDMLKSQESYAKETSVNNRLKNKNPKLSKSKFAASIKDKLNQLTQSKLASVNPAGGRSNPLIPLNSETVNKECPFSNIRFLNDFESSFLSSRKELYKLIEGSFKENYAPCAVPLAPPTAVKEVFRLQNDLLVTGSSPGSAAPNHACHDVSNEDQPRTLTVQHLPCISAAGRTLGSRRNFKVEEIAEKGCSGNAVQITPAPSVSPERKSRLSGSYLGPAAASSNSNKNSQSSAPHSVHCMLERSPDSPSIHPCKEILKELARELSEEFRNSCCLNTVPKTKSENNSFKEESFLNDCNMDAFIGDIDSVSETARQSTATGRNLFSSTEAQTSDGPEVLPSGNEEVKIIIRDELASFKEFLKQQNLFPQQMPLAATKVHKEIQTDFDSPAISHHFSNFSSTSMQVSPALSQVTNHSAEVAASRISDINLTEDTGNTPGSGTSLQQINVQKLEFMLNHVYEQIQEQAKVHASSEIEYRAGPFPVATREVSVQYNPVSTFTKATCTSGVMRVDAGSQSTQSTRDTSVQVVPVPYNLDLLETDKRDSCVQCDVTSRLVSSYAQTARAESSGDTWVSGGDSLDDMLSEGEVILPWSLRLLSVADAPGSAARPKSSGEVSPEMPHHLSSVQSCSSHASSLFSEGEIRMSSTPIAEE